MKKMIIELLELCDDEKMLAQIYTLLYLWTERKKEAQC